jgi:exodeoxyribonuclease VII large subunit
MISDKKRRLREMAQVTDDFHRDLCREMEGILSAGRERFLRQSAQLEALSPLAVLGRGYCICRRRPSLEVVRDAGTVVEGDDVSIRLHRGELRCRVVGTSEG